MAGEDVFGVVFVARDGVCVCSFLRFLGCWLVEFCVFGLFCCGPPVPRFLVWAEGGGEPVHGVGGDDFAVVGVDWDRGDGDPEAFGFAGKQALAEVPCSHVPRRAVGGVGDYICDYLFCVCGFFPARFEFGGQFWGVTEKRGGEGGEGEVGVCVGGEEFGPEYGV